MSDAVRLVLLCRGGPRIVSDDGVSAMLGGSSGALLAVLALSAKRDIPREWASGLLWPERDAAGASRGLTDELRNVRAAVSEAGLGAVVAERAELRLDIDLGAVDVLRFESLASSDAVDELGEALDLYDADLLDGFVSPSSELDSWLSGERARLRNLAVSATTGLMETHLEAGRSREALAATQRLLTLDPGHEAAHRVAMRLLAETGRRAEAVRQFEICRDTLARDFGLAPESETVELLAAIQSLGDQGVSPPVPQATDRAGSAIKSPPSRKRRLFTISAVAVAFLPILYLAANQTGMIGRQIQPANTARIERPLPEVPSVIITSFAYDAGDPELGVLAEYVADALAENLLAAVGLVVIDAREITRVQSEPLSPATAAETYGVRYFIQGRVRRSGGSVKLSIGLIDALAGAHKWEKTYRFSMAEAAELQEQLAVEILVELEVELLAGGISRPPGTTNLEAWAMSSEALHRLRMFSPEQNRVARDLYQRARQLDPNYPGAVGGLGWTYFIEAYFGWTENRAASLREAGRLAAESIALDPTRPRTLALLGAVTVFQDPKKGMALVEQAVVLAPSSAEDKAILGLLETYVGDSNRAVELFLQAKRLSVRAPDWFEWGLGRALRRAGRFDEAVAVLRASCPSSDELGILT